MKALKTVTLFLLLLSRPLLALDSSIAQLAVSIAPTWNSPAGKLQLFEREGTGWRATSPPMRVLYGKNGLAWGRGVLGINESGLQKTERDKRAPAGVFKIGTIYTYDPALPEERDTHFARSRKPTPGSTTRTSRTTISMSLSIHKIRRRGLRSKKCV